MHKNNIDTLRDEAKRQLRLLKDLLQKANNKGLVEAPAVGGKNRATFDSESLPKALEVLDGESYKLDHLDMVLAARVKLLVASVMRPMAAYLRGARPQRRPSRVPG